MVKTKFYNLDTDTNLGGENSSDLYVASEKAVKAYADTKVPSTRKVNNKALSSDITLSASDVGALPDSTVIPTITDTYSGTSSDGMSGKAVASAISGLQPSNTAVTHTASTAVGNNKTPVYVASDGTATALNYTIETSVPSGAVFTDTKNTAGGDDTSSKIFLVGMTAQTTSNGNSRTYTQDTAFVDVNGRLNSAAPATSANDTTVATTKWVKDQGYTGTTATIRVWS